MSRSVLILLAIAIFTVILYTIYQFMESLNGENTGFSKYVTGIESDLGKDVLESIKKYDSNAPIRDESLDNK